MIQDPVLIPVRKMKEPYAAWFCHWIKKGRDQTKLEDVTKKFKKCYFSNHIRETEDDFYELEKEIQKYEDIRSEKKVEDYKDNDSMRNNEGMIHKNSKSIVIKYERRKQTTSWPVINERLLYIS